MKKILPIAIIGIFVLSGFGASALNKDIKESGSDTIEYQLEISEESSYTHNVLIEFGTTSSCPNCPSVRGYLDTIYSSDDYDFYYVTLNADKEPLANARYWELPGAQYVPTAWFDGAYKYLIGNQGSTTPYITYINNCGARSVADIDLEVSIVWLGGSEMEVKISVTNNAGSSYSGHLHAYVTEIESRWYDYSVTKYDFSMIGYAFNKNINVGASNTWSETVTWNGGSHGYGNIVEDNIMIVASVFNPNSKYADETAAATTSSGDDNKPPDPPYIYGPTSGKAGIEYDFTFVTTDPEGSDVYYWIEWGDGTIEQDDWIGPYSSGEEITLSHSWSKKGQKYIKAKAKDEQDKQSIVITRYIDIPRNRYSYDLLLLHFLERYLKAFPTLVQLLNI